MVRYFQHIDPSNEELFLKVTTLDYIDDVSTPSIQLCYFSDGTYCNRLYIAGFNTPDDKINKYVMAEVISPNSVWTCEKVNLKRETRTATTADGQKVVIADPYLDDPNVRLGMKYNFLSPDPVNVERFNKINDNIETWYISNVIDKLRKKQTLNKVESHMKEVMPRFYIKEFVEPEQEPAHDENKTSNVIGNVVSDTDKQPVTKAVEPSNVSEMIEQLSGNVTANDENESKAPYSYLNAGNLIADSLSTFTVCDAWANTAHFQDDKYPFTVSITKSNNSCKVSLNLMDGRSYTAEELHKALDMYDTNKLQKAWEQNLETKHEIKEEDIAETIGADKETYEILNNMIKKAVKNAATASVDIDLDLPPVEVYKLLTSAYPEDWKTVFLQIIAHNVSIPSLRKALATGLEQYYTADDKAVD